MAYPDTWPLYTTWKVHHLSYRLYPILRQRERQWRLLYDQCFMVHWCDGLYTILLLWPRIPFITFCSFYQLRKFTSTIFSVVHIIPNKALRWYWTNYIELSILLRQQTLMLCLLLVTLSKPTSPLYSPNIINMSCTPCRVLTLLTTATTPLNIHIAPALSFISVWSYIGAIPASTAPVGLRSKTEALGISGKSNRAVV